MPSLNELLKAAGVEVPESVDLAKLVDESDEVKGLVQTKSELLAWKNDNKPKLDQLETLVASQKEDIEKAFTEKSELAIKNNDLSAHQAAEKERADKLEMLLSGMKESTKKAAQEKAVSEIAGLFQDPVIGESFALAKGFVNTNVGDNGEVVTTFKLGESEYSDYSAFSEALSKDKTYGSHMKVGEASGPRINGSDPRPQTKEDPDAAFKERLASAGLTQQ